MKNFINTCFNPFHTLFFIYQYYKKFKYQNYFNTVEKKPLTDRQRQSIILNQKRNLIIAGAGTGKTSTIIGKIGYLVKNKNCFENDILVIAYNRNAAMELKERVKNRLALEVSVGTFHSTGKKIIKNCNIKNNVTDLVEQDFKFNRFANKVIDKLLSENKDTYDKYKEFFLMYEYPETDNLSKMKSLSEHAVNIRTSDYNTLNYKKIEDDYKTSIRKERVKSHSEVLIANFLFANGIKYEYEKFYVSKDAYHSYKPDFYLTDYDIYIEFFGIDKNNNPAPYINKQKYFEEMNLKINMHKKNGTKLIKLYYHQKQNNKLLLVLESELKKYDVRFNPIPSEEMLLAIEKTKKKEKFIDLIVRFLNLYKENYNYNSLVVKYHFEKADTRTKTFLSIFFEFYNAYQEYLSERQEIDFTDMISIAKDLVEKKKYISDWKYILIDEFQDISKGRYKFISALVNQNKKTRLFCVGDDWQSIYRFAGSNNAIIREFGTMFGAYTKLILDTSFRYNNKISKVSEKFITKNKYQIKKNIKTLKNKNDPQVFLHWTNNTERFEVLISVISNIEKENVSIVTSAMLQCC